MTAKEFEKLKIGDKVRWQEGGNGCAASDGTVFDNQYGNRGILWDDGQETYPSNDNYVMQWVELPQQTG